MILPVYLRPWLVVRPRFEPGPPAQQTGAIPTELTGRRLGGAKCPESLHDFWNSQLRIVVKCVRIVIPTILRPNILNTINQGHLGVEKCLLSARSSVYWQGITKYTTFHISQCDTCQKHQRANQKERSQYCN